MPQSSNGVRRVGFSLGSNLGDRLVTLESVCDYLSDVFGALRLSQVYETEPVGCPEGSPAYLNACVEVETDMPAPEIHRICQQIEQELGRTRSGIYGEARTCDIDILYCGDEIYAIPELTIPHPRLLQRAFVLRPLCDIDPTLVLPGSCHTIQQHLDELADAHSVTLFPL